ncbi:MAG: enoyl-CoA hydratase/isomerase family protein [Bdellovibrionaceae bacterium]|nr:enoyl-CoA hydratase/isomerase family protein [Pseudobdellovibrionaceae bacterium]
MNHLKKQLLNNFCIITLNRPEVKNAFNAEMIQEITEMFTSIGNEENIKAVILKGEGTTFCAGADLNWMKSMIKYSYQENLLDSQKLWDMFAAIKNCSHPLIAQIHGAVFGGGLGILACCDYVIAEEKTKFCFSEVKLGLAPAVISSFILKKCADSFVRPMMISGEAFNAVSAQAMGLVHSIYQKNMPIEDIVNKFSDNGAEGMRESKKLLNALAETPHLNDHMRLTTEVISKLRMSDDAQFRLQKFLDKK